MEGCKVPHSAYDSVKDLSHNKPKGQESLGVLKTEVNNGTVQELD